MAKEDDCGDERRRRAIMAMMATMRIVMAMKAKRLTVTTNVKVNG